jgi:hypothetical protein
VVGKEIDCCICGSRSTTYKKTQIGVQSVVGRVLNYWILKLMVCISDVVLYRFDCSTELPL